MFPAKGLEIVFPLRVEGAVPYRNRKPAVVSILKGAKSTLFIPHSSNQFADNPGRKN